MASYTPEFWRAILPLCDHWRTLTPAQRGAALNIATVFRPASAIPSLPPAARAAFLEKDDKGRLRAGEDFIRFRKMMFRALGWSLEAGLDLTRYLQEMTTTAQRHALAGGRMKSASEAAADVGNRLRQGRFGQDLLASPTAESFLAGMEGWQGAGISYGEAAHRGLQAWFRAKSASEWPAHLMLTETFRLPGVSLPPEALLAFLLEYGVAVLGVNPENLMPLVNLPRPKERIIQGPGNLVLEPFAGTRSLARPFLLDDMAACLREAKAKPAPLLGDGVSAPMAHHRKVGKTFLPLPFEVSMPGWEAERRAEAAWWMLRDLGLLAEAGRTRKGATAGPAPAAEAWLAKPREERLQDVLERYPAGFNGNHKPRRRLSFLGDSAAHSFPDTALDQELMIGLDEAVACLDKPADMAAWFQSAMEKANPFLAALDRDARLDQRWRRWEATPQEAYGRLLSFHVARLCALGALELHADAKDRRGLVLTGVGRWLFGKAKAWSLPAVERSIAIIGGDFTVTLLEASPDLEAELAAFTVPVAGMGGAGAAYRLTRASVQQAVHGGMAAEKIIAVLKAWAKHALPANVVHEIGAWAGARRTFKVREAILVEGDDPIAVAELLASAPKDFVRLSPTVLSYVGKSEAGALFQKLSKKGFHISPTR